MAYLIEQLSDRISHDKMGFGELAVLTAAVQFGSVQKSQLITLTGYAKSSRDAYIYRLNEKGYISISGQTVSPTDAGITVLGSDYEPLPTGDDLWRYWQSHLPEGELKVLSELMSAGQGVNVSKSVLMESTGYAKSSVDAYLYRLEAKRLVVNGRGESSACEDLFD